MKARDSEHMLMGVDCNLPDVFFLCCVVGSYSGA
jgi:hypothetical protein